MVEASPAIQPESGVGETNQGCANQRRHINIQYFQFPPILFNSENNFEEELLIRSFFYSFKSYK